QETRSKLAAEGVQTDYMRIRAFPFSKSVIEFLADYSQIFVVEQNRDAQLRSLLQTEAGVSADKLIPILSYGGMPISCEDIYEPLLNKITQGKAA
ncbi:MAG: 2-oxoacid:acceptor oxidoreductase subunit alpha, partial [Pseudomonadota bacterium]|nr:2-oxoacid:acceptor oxidoreductase subunit alpha [Pseudomonadota bacterium]